MTLAVEASEQIADVFLYLQRISDTLGIDLLKATYEKMEKTKKNTL